MSELLDMHCEARGTKLLAAFDALMGLSADERKAVLSAVRAGRDLPIRQDMRRYRVGLAATLRCDA